MKIVLSAGHGKNIPGSSGYLDEFDENVRVVEAVAELLPSLGAKVETFIDEVSRTQTENLKRIVNFHNGEERDLDVSIHFNANETTSAPMGTECLYLTQEQLARDVSADISHSSGLKNRGPKKRTDLYFLNKTEMPAILIEVCFVDSRADADLYEAFFDQITAAIAQTISGSEAPPVEGTFQAKGKASVFGGPEDMGVSPSEGLAFIQQINEAPHLFLPYQPSATTGLARRLNPYVHYIACRWDYSETPKEVLLQDMALVKASKTGIALKAFPADWGPAENTGRVADLSPSLMDDLGIQTDEKIEIIFPKP
jgi:N-acetylmuramoyl-L-alanine amidase